MWALLASDASALALPKIGRKELQVDVQIDSPTKGILNSRFTKLGCLYSILSEWYVGLPQGNPYDSTFVLVQMSVPARTGSMLNGSMVFS